MRHAVVASFAALVLAWVCGLSWFLGKDLNWDFINYHLYGPHLLLHGRWDQDYFAGSFQGYLNPLAQLPHYLMVLAGWHSVLIGTLLAVVHAANLALVWLLAIELLPARSSKPVVFPMLAVLLAMVAPLFITTAGSSFADPVTSLPILAGFWLLLRSLRLARVAASQLVLAGILIGAATGLKLTNGLFLVAAVAVFPALWGRQRQPWARYLGLVLLGAFLGGLATHGYWSWLLWREFGNPVFPLFNNVFAAPDFPAAAYRDTRFLGGGVLALLELPFRMALPVTWLYTENTSVDLRPAAFVCLLLAAAAWTGWRLLRPPQQARQPVQAPLLAATAFALIAYLVWGSASRIGRYALPLWLLLGPLVVAWTAVLLPKRWSVGLLLMLAIAQAGALVIGGNPRWTPTRWTDRWVEVEVPPQLQGKLTFLTLGQLSYSVVVPFLHPEARVVNLVGQHIQPAGARMTQRLRGILQQPTPQMRVAFKDLSGVQPYQGTLAPARVQDVNAVLSIYGLQLRDAACLPMRIGVEFHDRLQPEVSAAREQILREERLHACEVERLAPGEHVILQQALSRVDRAFDAVERACGARLSPHGTQTLRGQQGWLRTYFNSLHTLVSNGEVVYVRPFRSMVDFDLGRLEDWLGTGVPACPPLPHGVNRLE